LVREGDDMKIRSVLLFTALASISAFGQGGKVSVSLTDVTAGKNITIAITLNDAPSIDGTQVRVQLGPKDSDDHTPDTEYVLIQQGNPLVYNNTCLVPPVAKGTWVIKNVRLWVPGGENVSLTTNLPELKVKPIKVVLPSSGTVQITVP
jgi:hypothetical protein